MWRETSAALSATFALQWEKMWKLRYHRPFFCRGGTRRQSQQQQSNFVSKDTNEEAFYTDCDRATQFARKYFPNLHLIHGEKTKVAKVQIDSAST